MKYPEYGLRLLTLACLTTGFMTPLMAGTMVEMDVNDRGQIVAQTVYVDGGKIAATLSDQNTQVLFDADTRVVTIVDHGDRTFTNLTEADIDSVLGFADMLTGSGLNTMITDQIESLPADQQAEAQKMLEALGLGSGEKPAQTKVIKTGNVVNVNGMDCELYVVKSGQRQTAEACVGSAEHLGIPDADWATFRVLLDISWKYMEKASDLARRFGAMVPDLGPEPILGIPIQFIDAEAPEQPLVKVKNIDSTSMPPELKSVPEGYLKSRLPIMQ